MSGRRLRYEALLLALLGFEVGVISLLSFSLGRGAAGGGTGWLPLFLAGAAMLAWNRFLMGRSLWGEARGYALSLVGALSITSLLMATTAPVTFFAGPRAWGEALTGLLYLFEEQVPLTVVMLVSLLLWYRAVLVAQGDASLGVAISRFRWSLLAITLLLVEAASRGVRPPRGACFRFLRARCWPSPSRVPTA